MAKLHVNLYLCLPIQDNFLPSVSLCTLLSVSLSSSFFYLQTFSLSFCSYISTCYYPFHKFMYCCLSLPLPLSLSLSLSLSPSHAVLLSHTLCLGYSSYASIYCNCLPTCSNTNDAVILWSTALVINYTQNISS